MGWADDVTMTYESNQFFTERQKLPPFVHKMRLVLFAVLFLFIFDAISSESSDYLSRIENCTADPQSHIGEYSYGEAGNVPICPLTSSSPNIRWSYNLNGTVSVFSNQSFRPDQICVSTNLTKLFFLPSFISNNSNSIGYFSFKLSSTILDVRYAPIGIFQIEPSSNSLLIDEGQSFESGFIFLSYKQLDDSVNGPNLYKVSANGDLTLVPASDRGVSVNGLTTIGDYCAPGMFSTPVPNAFGVRITDLSLADSGTYTVIVTIDGVNYTANFTITVSPVVPTISPSPTTTDSVIISSSVVSVNESPATISTTGSTVSSSVPTTITVSPSPTEETSGITLVLYVVFGFLVFIGIVVCIIVVVLILLWCLKVKNERRVSPPVQYAAVGEEEEKIGGVTGLSIAEAGRTDSNSSNRPLVHSRLSSTSSTPSTKQEDYTAVYCDERHANIGEKWKEKLGNKCVLLRSDNNILASLENSSCCEIFVYADPRDPVIVATISRGSPRGREKLKWWQFVEHDKTPDHLVGVEGFKIVQVEGDPNEFSTLQLGMLKTDYPTLNHSNGVLHENLTPNGHTSYPEGTDSEKKKSKDETDGLTSNDGGSTTDPIQELLKEQRKTNQILKEINKNSEKTAKNTDQIAETEQSIFSLHEEALVGITEASV